VHLNAESYRRNAGQNCRFHHLRLQKECLGGFSF
jgi:hypothetical protein